ncbi:MAG: hypothetical protein OXJ52_09025 [Oligoflexia bacterium]|nr:hypothetical protein [Oligoflexia bacterium]
MKKLSLLFICVGLAGMSCQSNTNPQSNEDQVTKRRLLGSWETIHTLIPEVKQSYNNLITKKITINDFKENSSALLQAYSFFFFSLKDKVFMDKHTKLVQFVSSHNQSESIEAMKQVYAKIEKLNKEWQASFPTKEIVLEKWQTFK